MEEEKRLTCPVTVFLGLALADDVFVKEKTAQAFATRSIPETTNSMTIPIRKEKGETPILRTMNGSAIDTTKILKASSLHHALISLGQRCGYKERISAYAFRRGFASSIVGTVILNIGIF
jgi:hypothetical protein